MGVTFEVSGDTKKIENFINRMKNKDYIKLLDKYGQAGVDALSAATPVDSGKTASSWNYEISKGNGSYIINWTNSNINNGVNIAIILQYGHGTGTGGYVQGQDYINPATLTIFQRMADEAWKVITNG